MRVLYNNIIKNATINPSTQATGYEASVSLKDSRLARKWRSTGLDWQGFDIFDASSPSATYCVIAAHNLTSDAVANIYGSTDALTWTLIAPVLPIRATNYLYDSAGDYLVDETGDPCATYDYPSPLVVLRDTRIASFSSVGYPYYRVSVYDPLNPDGFYEIGHVYIGESLTLPSMAPDMEIPTTSTADVSSSLAGQRYGDSRVRLKTASIKAPAITNDQKIDIETWFDTVDIIDPFWLLVWESDLWAEMPIYCALTKDLKWKKDAVGTSWTLDFEFLEVR